MKSRKWLWTSVVSLFTALAMPISVGAQSAQTSPATAASKPADPSLPAIHGRGTARYLSKFTDANDIGNSGIFESAGGIFTKESFTAGAISGQIDAVPGTAAQGINSTSQGSTAQDASWTSGIRGLIGSTNSPAGVGVFGTSTATVGDPVGVLGVTSSTDRGIGVRGQAYANAGLGIGVLGGSNSLNGIGMIGVNGSPFGFTPIGIFGYVVSADGGFGVLGRAWSTTGFGVGVRGESLSPNGVGGLFENQAGGNLILGLNTGVPKFRVDGAGTVFADGGFQPNGADFAESMPVAGNRAEYSAGDLLVIDETSSRRLAVARQPYSTLVAGIYSTKPGMLGSTHTVAEAPNKEEVPLAVVGIVPCKVTTENGPIRVGDLLVSSSTPGYAMKGTDRSRMLGAVVGKALDPLTKATGTIQVLVTLQ